MKKIVFAAAAAAAFALPAAGHTQSSASGTVNATANVSAYIAVNKLADLNFGMIAPGSGATITPGTPPTGTGQTMGVLKVDFNSAATIAGPTATGLQLSGASDLPVAFSCGYSATQTGALTGAATACGSMGGITYSGTGAPTTQYIQVGGAITGGDTTNRLPGTYTANLLFTVTAVN